MNTPSQDAVTLLTDPNITVDIVDDGRDGNREHEIPTIAVITDGNRTILHLTWNEARELADALQTVEGIARNG